MELIVISTCDLKSVIRTHIKPDLPVSREQIIEVGKGGQILGGYNARRAPWDNKTLPSNFKCQYIASVNSRIPLTVG